jgi:hypothetical protein
MPNRVIGNNTSFTFSSFSAGTVVTDTIWNAQVAQNLVNAKNVMDRIPSIYAGQIIGLSNSTATSWTGTPTKSRHASILTSWTTMPGFLDDLGNTRYHIYPKNITTGPYVMNTIGNYFVFYTPGIYHIEVRAAYTTLPVGSSTAYVGPTMLRMAIVPYVNNGANYSSNPPFDNVPHSTNSNGMMNCLLAYTGRIDSVPVPPTTYSPIINLSGFVLVTGQTIFNANTFSNIAITNTDPLTPGNAYHIEVEGMYANNTDFAGNGRFTINDGHVQITLVQEWWQ